MPELIEARIERSVVLNGVAIGIKRCRVEIAKGAMAKLPVIRQSDVAAPEVNACVVT